MKIPLFVKTIRFRLTVWYTLFLILILAILVIGVNIALIKSRSTITAIVTPYPGDSQSWRQLLVQLVVQERQKNLQDLRTFSLIGVGAVLVLGAVGGYFLSGFMLTPVDRVSLLASRISHTNLKERIKYRGPNDEVKRLADTFDTMLERLESAFASQKQFIQDASHELRTPIAIAQTNIEVLEMDNRATAEDYKKLVEILKMSLQRMNDINNNLLLLSEEAPAPWHREPVDMVSLLNEVYTETKAEASAAGISLEWHPVDAGLFVSGDALRLKQIFINLVDNAVKYSRAGGTAKISERVDGDSAVIQVMDTGIGISAEDLAHVFDRFFRVDKSRSREHGGSGLGLSIVRKIVEDHHGSVRAESVPGAGSTFTVTLPRITE